MDPLSLLPKQDAIKDDHVMDPIDSGWRKYFLVFVTVAVLLYGMWWSGDASLAKEILERRSISYTTFCEFLLAAVGLYFGANVAGKWSAGATNVNAIKAKGYQKVAPEVEEPIGKAE